MATEIEYTEKMHEESLHEALPPVEIGTLQYPAGTALKELDPTAFRCNWSDNTVENARWECDECGGDYDTEEESDDCCPTDDKEGE